MSPVNVFSTLFLEYFTNKTLSFTDQYLRPPTGAYNDYGLNSASFLYEFTQTLIIFIPVLIVVFIIWMIAKFFLLICKGNRVL